MAKKENKSVEVQTRKNEERFITSHLPEMFGKHLVSNLRRKWTDDFVDEDTGEVVSIERYEIIEQRGKLIDEEVLARIQFYIQSGDIIDVEVSNQCREGYLALSGLLSPWSVTASMSGKKRRFLLYAETAMMAIEIAKDFIELNFSGSFYITSIKTFDWSIFIKESIIKNPDEADTTEKEFYKIEVEVMRGDITYSDTFVLQTKDVDTGAIAINNWISNNIKEQNKEKGVDEEVEFTTTVKSGVIIPCYRIIEQEFSQAYLTPQN